MKIIKILSILLLSILVIPSCEDSEDVVTGVEGGLVEIANPSINYVVGNSGPYNVDLNVFQGEVKTVKIDIYKSFQTGDNKSNEVLFKTLEISDVETAKKSFQFSLDELIQDLTVGGNPLPDSDTEYLIGDFWSFRYVATTKTGNVVQQNQVTKITVATRFAGKYRFVEGTYYRIGVLTSAGDYWEDEYLFESIDAKTYKMNGVCAWLDQELYFQIEEDLSITYPLEWKGVAQIINDSPLITCADNLGDMQNSNCATSNYVIKDDVTGKDRLIMSFGYYTAGSGSREFYQVMEKIVE
ncbi:MAG: hypothetical protein GX126_06065 [Bacteroidales bacterium]|nr:hypothetical protein [Bacteroidales bacterium]